MERGRGHLVRDRVCLSLAQVSEGVEKAGAAVPLGRSLAGVLVTLSKKKGLASFVNGVRERVCVDGVSVFNGDVRMQFVKPRFIDGGLCNS